ncbi:flagellar filament capping protein FliD [candidate division KSB1 bacterium]
MAEISGLGGLSSVDTLVNQFLEVEKRPLRKLESDKSGLNQRLAVFSDLRAELKTLQDRIKGFLSVGSSATLGTKQAVSSNPSVVSAEATASAEIGVNTIFVSRIARRDTLLSDRIRSDGRTIAQFFGNSTQTFSIRLGENDPVQISVNIANRFETNETVLQSIADAINDADIGINANIVSVDRHNIRLSLVSTETGSSNEISFFGNSGQTLLKNLGLIDNGGQRETATNTKGGFILQDAGELDSLFTLNGVEISRESNTVSEVIKGLTITLLKAQEEDAQAETITVESDGENLRAQIEGFIEDYNSALRFINAKTGIDTATGTRNALSGNFQALQLRIKLREIVSSNIKTGSSSGIDNLTDIGIEKNRDGTLKIEDQDKFNKQISENAEVIRELFTAEDIGLAHRLDERLNRFVRIGGVISDNESGLNIKIRNIDRRKKQLNERLRGRESNLRRQFTAIQRVLNALNTQQQLLQRINFSAPTFSTGISNQQQYGTFFSF